MPTSLTAWLDHIARLHAREMDLGLDRVAAVWSRLSQPDAMPSVVTIAGTNGKGTCAHFLDLLLRAHGARTGLYTSPHLLRFSERIRIDGTCVDDAELCRAFAQVEKARGEVSLTFFEFTTLAAFVCFQSAALEVLVLEVGLGGRLDAVNVLDADVAVVTRIGLDHTDYLGDSLTRIGREKAGVFRSGRPAIVCGRDTPQSVAEAARDVGAELLALGDELRVRCSDQRLELSINRTGDSGPVSLDLPRPDDGQTDSMTGAIAAAHCLDRLPSDTRIAAMIEGFALSGRQQFVPGSPSFLLDVAHNPQAAESLAKRLVELPGRKRILLGMLAGKDVGGFVGALRPHASTWHAVSTHGSRGLAARVLGTRLAELGVDVMHRSSSVAGALSIERARADMNETIVVCGSFQIVGPALAWLGLYSDAFPTNVA
ncbi:MAG: bifunctional tetrahydrofolate synthase/dihydrofolate synthase [Pseudomonadota bacterium]